MYKSIIFTILFVVIHQCSSLPDDDPIKRPDEIREALNFYDCFKIRWKSEDFIDFFNKCKKM